MSWGERWASEHHGHREIDEERWDRERAITDAESRLDSRIDDVRSDNGMAREELWTTIDELRDDQRTKVAELWTELTTLRTQLTTLAERVGQLWDADQNRRI